MAPRTEHDEMAGANRSARSVIALALAVAGLVAIVGGTTSAHSGFQSYVYVSIFGDSMDGRVEYPVRDLGSAIGVEFPADADGALEVAQANADAIIAYTAEHLALGDGDATWELRFDSELGVLEVAVDNYILVPFEVEQEFDEVPRTFVATYSGIIESNPERDALFLVENDWESATFANEGEHLLGFSVGAETQVIELDESSTFESVTEVARRGSGAVDRSLIVLSALIAVLAGAALGTRRAGRPVSWLDSIERTGRRLLLFAGPMTLVLAILGLASVDVTEGAALGIGGLGAFSAAASILLPAVPARLAVAASGAAAGTVLAESFVVQQLDRARPVLAMTSFAVAAVVTAVFVTALLLPLALLAHRTPRAGLLAQFVAVCAGLTGVVWLVRRQVKIPRIRSTETTIADIVTSPIVIGVLTAIAAVLAIRHASGPAHHPAPSAVGTDRDAERIEA